MGKTQSSAFRAAAMVLAILLSACKPAAPEPSAPAVQFQADSFDVDDIGWTAEMAAEFGFGLEVSGLCAIDKNVAFLFGGVRVPAGTLRSFLLRTADGGKTWREVMPPVRGSDLTNVTFTDELHGWALAMWTVEGPGEIVLFGSKDGGRTWRQLAEIERSEGHAVPDGWPLTMTFQDASHGEIALAYDPEESASLADRSFVIDTHVSNDGGSTWKMVRRTTRVVSDEETAANRQRGFDNTDWVVDVPTDYESPMTVKRFDRERNRWISMQLPQRFKYQHGRVVL